MSATSSSDGLRDLAPRRSLGILPPLAAQRLLARHRGVADRRQHTRRGPGQRLPAARRQVLQHQRQALARLDEPVRDGLVDQLPAAPRRRGDGAGGQLRGRHAGDAVDQLVRLVHDHHVVLGQHGAALERVDGEQRVVGDDDVRPPGLRARLLREAVVADRAARGAQALAGADRHLPPRRLGHAGDELVAVAGLGVAAPLVDALDRAPERRDREGVEQLLGLVDVVAVAVQLVQAQVVAAALEDRERRRPAEQRRERLRQPGQVPVDELALQRDRRRRDDDRGAALDGVPDRRHEVGQRLAGAGARLHRQVLAGGDRLPDGLGHGVLPVAPRTADGGDRGVEELGDTRQGRRRRPRGGRARGRRVLGGRGRHPGRLPVGSRRPRRNDAARVISVATTDARSPDPVRVVWRSRTEEGTP